MTRLRPALLAHCRALARELEGLPKRTPREQDLLAALWLIVTEGPHVERVLAARELMSAARAEPD